MCGNIFVFRPGGIPGGNVFTDWPSLISWMSCAQGRKILEFDDSLSPLTPPRCEIPAGTWPMRDVMWAGFGPRQGKPRTVVYILSGAVFTDLRMIGGQITIVNTAMGAAPFPVSDFGSGMGDHLQIGLRDDGGNTQLVNTGDVPMFNLGTNSALFFLQNCLFGMPQGVTTDVTNLHPLVRMQGNDEGNGTNQLTLNLLGQNQTGPNVVLCEPGVNPITNAPTRATVLFGALSSSAQVALKQDTITTGGNLKFGPQGRIQRLVIPRPPDAPATTSQTIGTPNVVVRCDGTHAFTQDLPSIIAGFAIGLGSGVNLYTGGQEIVVAEVAGGNHLSVRPTPNDTIDGSHAPVHIGKHGSRTFVSDGLSNWITISVVNHP